jgi:hypothetical protein
MTHKCKQAAKRQIPLLKKKHFLNVAQPRYLALIPIHYHFTGQHHKISKDISHLYTPRLFNDDFLSG